MRRHRIGEAAGPRRRPCRLLRKRLRDAGSPHGSSDARWLLKITGRMTPETATGPSASPRCDIAVSNGDNGPFLAAVGYRSRLGWSSAAATCLVVGRPRASSPSRRGLVDRDGEASPSVTPRDRPRFVDAMLADQGLSHRPRKPRRPAFSADSAPCEPFRTKAAWRQHDDVIIMMLSWYH